MAADTAEIIVKAVERRAMEILALEPERREAHFTLIREAYREAAIKLGQSEQKACETGDKMVELTRALVETIEIGGGAEGGRA